MRRLRLFHFDIPTDGNYGDTLLFEAVRETFEGFAGRRAFEVVDTAPLREVVGPGLVDRINECADAVVVGGGGLFLSDTNPNRRSGWQWNISLQMLRRLRVPLVIFAVGNNRFYGQPDFADPFREHLARTLDQSVFFGLRNHGSIRTIRRYVSPEAARRITYQPCPTTLASRLFPDLAAAPDATERVLGVQSIVGSRQTRVGFDAAAIYRSTVELLGRLTREGWDVTSVPFARADLGFRDVLADSGVPFSETRLFGHPDVLFTGVRTLARLPVFLGTRGHAQMVPFGVGAVPLSLDLHPKTGYFAQDIGHPEWVLDPRRDDFAEVLYRTVHEVEEQRAVLRAELDATQGHLADVTARNLTDIYTALAGQAPTGPLDAVPYSPFERHLARRAFGESLRRVRADVRMRELKSEIAALR